MAEASLMANLVDKTGDEKATVDNLIKKATGGWFAKGKSRFNNPGNPEQISIDAARTVLVEGKRTLPRYVDEHDCFSDLEWVKNDGASINKKDRSQYKPHVTKIKNVYGASGTFHSFPNDKSDPFYYTSEELRKKWGDECYSPSTSGAGMGDGKTHGAKGFGDNQSTPKTRYSGGAGMGDGGYTRHAIKAQTTAQRDIEKTVRKINNTSINVVPSTGNQQGLSKACVELLQAMITELQAINTNTAETAKGVSEIEIVSANEPISGLNGKKQGKATDTRHNSSDTGYNTARKIASFK
jgi:hypothetical protein